MLSESAKRAGVAWIWRLNATVPFLSLFLCDLRDCERTVMLEVIGNVQFVPYRGCANTRDLLSTAFRVAAHGADG